MSLRRLFPDRWARILTWTAAAVAWGTAAVAVSAAAPAEQPAEPETAPAPVAPEVAVTTATLPEPPADGLVIIRYTPADVPAAQVITQTVVVPGGRAAAAAPGPAPAPAPATVSSSGS